MEEHCKRTPLACVGSARSLWSTLGLRQLTAACAFPVYTAQAPGRSPWVLSKVDPAFRALPRSKLLRFRFSGTLQRAQTWLGMRLVPSPGLSSSDHQGLGERTVPGGPCTLIASLVLSAPWQHHLWCAVCLLWGVHLGLPPSWLMSTVHVPRKTWLATGGLLTVCWRMPVFGAEIASCLPPLCLWWERGMYTTG